MTSRTHLYVLLPQGHDPLVDVVPVDLEALLAQTPEQALGGGSGYEQQEDGRWWFSKMITGPDRLNVAHVLADRMNALGYRSMVRTRR